MSETAPVKEWVLEPQSEYRFELDPGTSIAVRLIRGHAEVFGAELVEGKTHVYGAECKAAIYTWQGCVLEVLGRPSTEYVSDETPMTPYANVALALEQQRVRALAGIRGSPIPDDDGSAPAEPPRVLVLGPENSGKTTVCKILANYALAAGQGWAPVIVNVDPAAGAWSIPGTISACAVSSPLGTSSGTSPLGATATTLPMHRSSNALLPLAYWYGHSSPHRNPLLLDRIIRNLGDNVHERWDYMPEARASGLIVDTPAALAIASAGAGAKGNEQRIALVKACVDAFRINVILVVGHEKLTVEMQRAYGQRVTVVKIPKSGGVVELDASYRERVTARQLHTYMYGEVISPPSGLTSYLLGGEATVDTALAPASTVINFNDLSIFRIGEETMAPTSALPIGAARVVSEMQPLPVDPSTPGSGLHNAVLALLAPPAAEDHERYDEEILDLSAVGFVVITGLDMANKKMTVLSPSQSSLTGKTAVVGSFEWTEQS